MSSVEREVQAAQRQIPRFGLAWTRVAEAVSGHGPTRVAPEQAPRSLTSVASDPPLASPTTYETAVGELVRLSALYALYALYALSLPLIGTHYECPHCTICPSQCDTGHASCISPSLSPSAVFLVHQLVVQTHSVLHMYYTGLCPWLPMATHGCPRVPRAVTVGSMQSTRVLPRGIGSRPLGGTDMPPEPPCYRWVGHGNDKYSTWQGKRPYTYIEPGRIRNACTPRTITASCWRPGRPLSATTVSTTQD